MGCKCNNNQIIEEVTEYKTEFINNETNVNNENINNKIDDNLSFKNEKIIKEEEIDTTIISYPKLVLNLINQIRQNPKEYANIIEESTKNIVEEKNEENLKDIKLIYKSELKVALVRGEPAFLEAAEELRNMEPIEPLEFREDNCLSLPDNLEDYDNSDYLKNKVREKLDNNIYINVFYKENVSNPDISVLLMIVDDRNKKNAGKKRKAILNKNFKYIGITSKYIDDIFISYFSFSTT